MKQIKKRKLQIILGSLMMSTMILGVFIRSRGTEFEQNSKIVSLFAEIKVLDNELNTNILRSHSFLLTNYDPIVANIAAMSGKIRDLKDTISGLNHNQDLTQSIEETEAAINKKFLLVEDFKTKNAARRNSLYYLPLIALETQKLMNKKLQFANVHDRINSIVNNVLQKSIYSSSISVKEIKDDLAWTTDLQQKTQHDFPELSSSLEEMILHIEIAINTQETVRLYLQEIYDFPLSEKLAKTQDVYQATRNKEKIVSDVFQVLLLIITLVFLIGGTIALIRLFETKDDLETLNAYLEAQVKMRTQQSLQNAKLASLGEMAAGIAHEINNPLAIISGNITLIKKFKDDPIKFEAKCETISKSADRISKIVKGLKKFSRSSDGAEYSIKPVSDILNEVILMTDMKSKRHDTPIEFNIQTQANILCDEVEIEQVLINLINNGMDAVQKLPEKWMKVNLFEENNQVVIQLIDSGSGISTDIEQKLFEPFFTTKVVGEGTGLGLSISKGILDEHKASIKLNRTFKNTCFEIRFKGSEEVKNVA
jgi:C4-dicarboxylate-specific signal transduction histidine kinase